MCTLSFSPRPVSDQNSDIKNENKQTNRETDNWPAYYYKIWPLELRIVSNKNLKGLMDAVCTQLWSQEWTTALRLRVRNLAYSESLSWS